jgi:hypothetical protein
MIRHEVNSDMNPVSKKSADDFWRSRRTMIETIIREFRKNRCTNIRSFDMLVSQSRFSIFLHICSFTSHDYSLPKYDSSDRRSFIRPSVPETAHGKLPLVNDLPSDLLQETPQPIIQLRREATSQSAPFEHNWTHCLSWASTHSCWTKE